MWHHEAERGISSSRYRTSRARLLCCGNCASDRVFPQICAYLDEKTFVLFGLPKNEFIWDAPEVEVPGRPTVKHAEKLHVWGGISWYGKTELYCFTGNMDGEFYEGILCERLPADIPRIFGDRDWVFQQDGDPKHTSKRVQAWLRANTPKFIPKKDWPANSPDLNPIENLWSDLQDRVYAREPRTLSGLQRIVEEEWEAYPIEKVRKLTDSLPRRLAAVQHNGGGSTRY